MRKAFLIPFIVIFLPVSFFSQKGSLNVVGTILAEERLFGHIYSDKAVNNTYLVVRVDKVLKGNLRSQFILMQRRWKLKDYPTPLDVENETQWVFSLKEDASCKNSLRELQFAFFGDDKRKINALLPRFRRKIGAESEILPFNEILPCYRFDEKKSKINSDYSPRQTNVDFNGYNPFVLEKNLIENDLTAPIKISWSSNGALIFTNTSGKPIKEFQLGCVVKQGSKNTILSKIPKQDISLEPENSLLTPKGSDGTNDNMDELYDCYKLDSKLMVVQATATDNTVWKLSDN